MADTASPPATTSPTKMLSDGSNPEGVDPEPPLNWTGKDSFKDVVFYGMHVSPPCTKIRAYLLYYDIDYRMVSCQRKKGSPYTKMPAL